MGLRRLLRALLDAVLRRTEPHQAHDAEDGCFAAHRRLLELADAARTSAAQLVAARARLDRELTRLPDGEQRTALEHQLADLLTQQEAAEAQASELAAEAATLRLTAERMSAERAAATSKARAAELSRRHAQLARDVAGTVREAEDETLKLVARGRALDEIRELEHHDLREVRARGADRRTRGL